MRRYVASADYEDGVLCVDLPGEERGGGGSAGGFDGELGPLVEEAEGVFDLVFGDEDAFEVAAELDRQAAGERRVEAVGDRARRDGDGPAGLCAFH